MAQSRDTYEAVFLVLSLFLKLLLLMIYEAFCFSLHICDVGECNTRLQGFVIVFRVPNTFNFLLVVAQK